MHFTCLAPSTTAWERQNSAISFFCLCSILYQRVLLHLNWGRGGVKQGLFVWIGLPEKECHIPSAAGNGKDNVRSMETVNTCGQTLLKLLYLCQTSMSSSIYICISSLAGLQRKWSLCSVTTTGVDAMFLAPLLGELLVDLPFQPHRAALSH